MTTADETRAFYAEHYGPGSGWRVDALELTVCVPQTESSQIGESLRLVRQILDDATFDIRVVEHGSVADAPPTEVEREALRRVGAVMRDHEPYWNLGRCRCGARLGDSIDWNCHLANQATLAALRQPGLGAGDAWSVRDTLTGAIYPQPNRLIADKVAEMHGFAEVIPGWPTITKEDT